MTEETPIVRKEAKPRMNNYGSNSHKSKEEPKGEERQKVEKAITGQAVQRKKPLGKKIAETFTGDDMHSVGNYVLFDVILPAAKSMISDAASQGIERLMFGDSARRPSSGISRGGIKHTSYNRMYSPNREDRPTGPRTLSQRARASHDFGEVVLTTRGEAETILDRLGDLIDNYDVATVSDLYDLAGITGSFTDDKWGWSSLSGSSVSRIREGYLLNLPSPTALD